MTMKKQKPYWQMNAPELQEATKAFDDPVYDPPALKPTRSQLNQLQRGRRKRAAHHYRISLVLEGNLVEATDSYASKHGVSFSDVVSDALRKLMRKKSA